MMLNHLKGLESLSYRLSNTADSHCVKCLVLSAVIPFVASELQTFPALLQISATLLTHCLTESFCPLYPVICFLFSLDFMIVDYFNSTKLFASVKPNLIQLVWVYMTTIHVISYRSQCFLGLFIVVEQKGK